MKKFTFLTVCTCFIGVASIVAQPLPNKGPMPFSTFDEDNNQVITLQEFENVKAKRMAQKLDQGKMLKNAGKSATFESIDLDGNGEISKEEFNSHQQQRFQQKGNQKNKGMGMGQGRNWQN